MFFLIVYGLFLLSNLLLYRRLRRGLGVWFPAAPQKKLGTLLGAFFIAANAPLLVSMALGWTGWSLERMPEPLLQWIYYPSLVWLAMLVGYFLLTAPKNVVVAMGRGLGLVYRRLVPAGPDPAFNASRRQFLAGLAPVAPTALLGTAAYGVYGTKGDLEVSPEIAIPIPDLPRQLDGFRITQLSDIHFGPYLRAKDMKPVVEASNTLRSELVVITGDILDRSLRLLGEAGESLQQLWAPFGVYAILGNHDYYSDQRNPLTGYPGCNRLVAGLEPTGIRFLRNERASIDLGNGAELLLAGLDWLGATRGDPNIYQQRQTRQALRRILHGSNPEAVRVLLAHHPHTFMEAQDFGFPLTLAGHTHGGGQVVLGYINGVPIGLAALRFRYIRGLYQESGRYLYVNRGIGYFGIPIRINCLPEISRFRLVRA
ncbi:MAG: metallophosphoesterase [Acidobacteria bacterium]|nr:metallophosphoesterase [Acidobacteriota bacterium]